MWYHIIQTRFIILKSGNIKKLGPWEFCYSVFEMTHPLGKKKQFDTSYEIAYGTITWSSNWNPRYINGKQGFKKIFVDSYSFLPVDKT